MATYVSRSVTSMGPLIEALKSSGNIARNKKAKDVDEGERGVEEDLGGLKNVVDVRGGGSSGEE